MPRSIKGEVAYGYVQKYPKLPSLTLAKKIAAENTSLFKNAEEARGFVRSYRGLKGEDHRKMVKENDYFVPSGTHKHNPFSIPDSWAEEKEYFKLPVLCNKVGFMSDMQAPFHDIDAVTAAIKHLKQRDVNTIFLNGDIVDFYGLSFFIRDPRKRNFKHERQEVLKMLMRIREAFPTQTIYYNLDANHEYRYERYMMVKAPELLDLEMFQIEELLCFDELKIKPIRNKYLIEIGRLPVIHGDTIFKGITSPACPARTIYMKLNHSGIASHCHRTSNYVDMDVYDKVIGCWTVGCLMSNNVKYHKHGNRYNHGFAVIETNNDGDYHVDNYIISNGKVL